LDASGIFLSQRIDAPHWQANYDVLLRAGGFIVDQRLDLAGGRITTALTRSLIVTCRTRVSLDESGKDLAWLFGDGNLVLGHLALEEAVVDALHEQTPTDASGNLLTKEPVKLVGGTEASKEGRDPNSWGSSLLTFSMVYLPPLTQKYQ
jgi:hypothetical protein